MAPRHSYTVCLFSTSLSCSSNSIQGYQSAKGDFQIERDYLCRHPDHPWVGLSGNIADCIFVIACLAGAYTPTFKMQSLFKHEYITLLFSCQGLRTSHCKSEFIQFGCSLFGEDRHQVWVLDDWAWAVVIPDCEVVVAVRLPLCPGWWLTEFSGGKLSAQQWTSCLLKGSVKTRESDHTRKYY